MIEQNGCFTKIQSKLIEMVEKQEIPSTVITIAQRGEVLWEEAFGWTDRRICRITGNDVNEPLREIRMG